MRDFARRGIVVVVGILVVGYACMARSLRLIRDGKDGPGLEDTLRCVGSGGGSWRLRGVAANNGCNYFSRRAGGLGLSSFLVFLLFIFGPFVLVPSG